MTAAGSLDHNVAMASKSNFQAIDAEAGLATAVLIPCFNEASAIAKVIADFRASLPHARIYVYDNNSSDQTRTVAIAAGAAVKTEVRQGKGNVVQRMFADVDADVYVIVDGDDTYDASDAPTMVRRLLVEDLDMVVGVRTAISSTAYRPGHAWGNAAFNRLLAVFFGRGMSDIFSGYRVFSRRFVKSFPALTTQFDTEAEMSVHCLSLGLPFAEVSTRFRDRPAGSSSKLRTYRDGTRILWRMLMLFKEERPIRFFGTLFAVFALLSLALGYPLLVTYLQTHLVPRLPTAVLAAALMLLAFISLSCGLVLDGVSRFRREQKRLAYLALSRVSHSLRQDDDAHSGREFGRRAQGSATP